MHVVVAGGGIFGQVIAWRLAVRGARVTLCEPVGPGAAGSGSGDRSRIVRALYAEPWFAEAGFAGLRLWSEWSQLLGARLIEPVGVVYLVRDDAAPAYAAAVRVGAANVRALGGAVEEVAPAAIAGRWPAMASADLAAVYFEPAAGFARAALATRTIARAAAATGRVTHLGAVVIAVEATADRVTGVRLRTAAGERVLDADAVVVAAGFAGLALVTPFCGHLPIERLVHFTSYWDVPYPEGAALHQSALPAWADLGAELYGFPDDGESGFKAAWHRPRPAAGAGSDDAAPIGPTSTARRHGPAGGQVLIDATEAPTAEEIEALRARVSVRFPALASGRCRGTYACAYDSTADETFQIGPVPGVTGLWFTGGLSGHGFKHAPSLGESVAAAVLEQPPPLDLTRYALRTAAPAT